MKLPCYHLNLWFSLTVLKFSAFFCLCVALLQQEGGETLLLSVRNLGCSCAIEKQPIPRSVSWIRRIPCAQVNTQYFITVIVLYFYCHCPVIAKDTKDTGRCIVLKLTFWKNVVQLHSVYGKFLDPKLFAKYLVEALFSLQASWVWSCKLCRIMKTTVFLGILIASLFVFL